MTHGSNLDMGKTGFFCKTSTEYWGFSLSYSFPRVNRPGREAAHSSHKWSKSRMNGALHLFPHTSLWRGYG